MTSREVVNICEAVLLQEPATPRAALLEVERMALEIGIKELARKRDSYERIVSDYQRELDGVTKERRSMGEAGEW